MLSYLVRRLGVAAITFVMGSILVFSIIQLPPGDSATYIASFLAGQGGDVEDLMETLSEAYGLDKPLYVQYYKWFSGFLRGDLGYSISYNRPVAEIVLGEIGWTILVTGVSFVFAWTIGIAIGIYSATHQYSLFDHVFTFFGFLGLSIPNFFLAMIILFLLVSAGTGITGGLFSREYATAPWSWGKFVDLMKHLWIPMIAIGTMRMASVIRIMRGNLLEVINKPYIRTARAKGLKERIVTLKHSVRVAINPLISLAGTMAPKLISGIVITAVVLNLPVIGPTFIEALKAQDVYLAGAYLMIILLLVLIGNLLADIALAWADPRIRYD